MRRMEGRTIATWRVLGLDRVYLRHLVDCGSVRIFFDWGAHRAYAELTPSGVERLRDERAESRSLAI